MSVLETSTLTLPQKPKTLGEFTFDGVISALWRRGLNTNEIAAAARLKESDVANRIAALRDAGDL